MNVVLFLGAGFSRAFGMPVMAEFNEYVRELRGMAEEQQALTEVVQQARQAHAFLKTHPFNIEDILTMAEMQHRLGLADERRAAAIKRLIHAVYSKPVSYEAAGALGRRFGLLLHVDDPTTPYDALKLLEEREEPALTFSGLSIITTNYDLNVETMLYGLGHRSDIGGGLEDQRDHSERAAGKELRVLPGLTPLLKEQVRPLLGATSYLLRSAPPSGCSFSRFERFIFSIRDVKVLECSRRGPSKKPWKPSAKFWPTRANTPSSP